MKKLNIEKLTKTELEKIVYELGIDEAIEGIYTREQLIDLLYDYGEDYYEFV